MEAARKLNPDQPVFSKKGEALAPSDIELLKTNVLLKGIDETLIETVAGFFEKVHLDRGEPIVLEQESSGSVYFIKSGSVEILKYLPAVKQVQRMTLLRAPMHFAEFSVLAAGTKTGSAFAFENCELLKIKGDNFLALLRQIPDVGARLCTHIANFLDNNLRRESIEIFDPRLIRASPDVGMLLSPNVWKKFNILPLSLERNLLRVAMIDPFQPGFMEAVRATNPQLVVCSYLISAQEYEGQFKRLQDIYATNKFPEQPKKNVEMEPIADLAALLKRSPIFNCLADETLNAIIPHFKLKAVQLGEAIFSPQSTSNCLYIIQNGAVEVTKVLSNSSVLLSLQRLQSGDHFGEESMIMNKNAVGYAIATRPGTIYTLPKEIFVQLLADPEFCREICKGMITKLQNRTSRPVVKYFSGTAEYPGAIPMGVMADHKVIDLLERDEEVIVGFSNPDLESAYGVAGRYLLGKRIKLELMKESELKRHVALAQGPDSGKKVALRTISDTMQALEELLAQGYNMRASDIHFEPTEHSMTVRYRIDGVLKEHNEKINATTAKEMISRLKIMSGMDISNHFTPQDGQLKIAVGGENMIARASMIPTKLGEKIVLRLIRSKSSIIPYNMIAPDRRLINILREVVNARQGLFMITGPTGSGKSTTLYSLLNELNRVDSNCVTLEDPVELNIPGVAQVEMNEKQGMSFAKALRSVLRQDPDVIMVGEVRDEESAEIVFKAAITGHLVLSTLHTNSSLDVTPRLRELGVTPSTIATGLIGVLAQRLVRGICRDCKDVRQARPYEIQHFKECVPGIPTPTTVLEGRGCARCNYTGFYDRIPVFEVWRKTPAMKNVLGKDGNYEDMFKAARADGFVTLLEFGMKLAHSGLTTVDEVLRCISET